MAMKGSYIGMPTDAKRQILERLATGEITADEAESELAAMESADPPGEESIHVQAIINSGGLITVEGTDIVRPYIDGPHKCRISRDGGRYEIRGQVGADAAVQVPAGADLELHLSGARAEIIGIRGTIDAHLNVGNLHIAGELSRGESEIHANAGDLHLLLRRTSSVRIEVDTIAMVSAAPPYRKTARGEWTLGDGRGLLTIDGNMGTVFLAVE